MTLQNYKTLNEQYVAFSQPTDGRNCECGFPSLLWLMWHSRSRRVIALNSGHCETLHERFKYDGLWVSWFRAQSTRYILRWNDKFRAYLEDEARKVAHVFQKHFVVLNLRSVIMNSSLIQLFPQGVPTDCFAVHVRHVESQLIRALHALQFHFSHQCLSFFCIHGQGDKVTQQSMHSTPVLACVRS